MSYPHSLEDVFSEVRLRDVLDAPHYVSVDSAPLGYAVARSRWIAPFFLSTFILASIAFMLTESWFRLSYVAYLESLGGVDTLTADSLGVRPIFFVFLLTFWAFANGTWDQKVRLSFSMIVACLLAIAVIDVALVRVGLARGVGPFSPAGNILVGFAAILTIIPMMMFSLRMPKGVRALTIRQRSLYYWAVASGGIVLSVIITMALLQMAGEELDFLRNIALLGGLGPGILLFSSILWPILAISGVIGLARRKVR